MRKITSILFLMSFFFLVIGDSYARRSPRAKKDDKIIKYPKYKTMKNRILFLIVLFSTNSSYSQSNDTEAALYNVGFGGITGAIGAVINKKPDEKFGKVLLKGLWQGALGGYVTFESKRIIRHAWEEEDWKLYWASKFVNAAGNSIKENAANNRNWHYFILNFKLIFCVKFNSIKANR